ncbi:MULTISPECIES: YciI family protein [unclassified Amycolatopsis]|uniref:YciI family protein n=1 Tax=unclassified Amycolatopsis TaxID=2618356 RepID=UPI002E13989D|nr:MULTISPECIES: YciI family protein [unclassified Amycolatopsis]WSJ74517.1 YciI family protein [Amycolatopsis sp. NBC_01307]WSK81831.1 YciI family protein [Amycolatopsis sp. NBC_01286]
MRFLVMVKSSPESETGAPPNAVLLEEMAKFNEELLADDRIVLAEGLTASAEGVRVLFEGDAEPKLIDGPFAESKELVAGVWVLNGESLDDVVALMKRAPNPEEQGGVIEIRPIAE